MPPGISSNVQPGDGLRFANGVLHVDPATGIAIDANGDLHVPDGGIDTAQLAASAITAAKLASGSVGSDELAADAVDSGKVAADAIAAALAINANGRVAVQVDGATVVVDANGNLGIPDGGVDTSQIATGAVRPNELSFDPTTQSELNNHAENAGAHHSRYSDSEARSAVGGQFDHGTYTGTGSGNTQSIDVKFRPRLVFIGGEGGNAVVRIDADHDGQEFDLSTMGATGGDCDLTSNGFDVTSDLNYDGQKYNWLAIG